MSLRTRGRLCITLSALCLAWGTFGTAARAAESEPASDPADVVESTPSPTAIKSARDPRSKSSQSLGSDPKRSKINLPAREDTAPATMTSKGLRGNATFYSPRFQGRKTASGDIFNHKLFTAASNLFPLGTLVAVKRPDTNLCVVVKVNDRMHPKHRTRVIDLTHSAAKYLDMVREGVVKVQVVRIPDDATPGSTFDCAMGYELEETCDNCEPPLQFLNN
jgi:rare lipoprotein A